MPDQAANDFRLWPSAREMQVVRAVMIVASVVMLMALLRHYDKIFELAAIGIVVSSGLLYRATHPRHSDRTSLPRI